MQLKRSYSRRLKFEIIIYEYNFITRRAYKSIKLAVKTSRPQYFKDIYLINLRIAKLSKSLFNHAFHLTLVQNLYHS